MQKRWRKPKLSLRRIYRIPAWRASDRETQNHAYWAGAHARNGIPYSRRCSDLTRHIGGSLIAFRFLHGVNVPARYSRGRLRLRAPNELITDIGFCVRVHPNGYKRRLSRLGNSHRHFSVLLLSFFSGFFSLSKDNIKKIKKHSFKPVRTSGQLWFKFQTLF